MPEVTFTCRGHENLLAKHRNTFEFTTDEHLTLQGDCIIGVGATSIPAAMEGDIEIIVEVNEHKWVILAEANPTFNSATEMVVRRTDFLSDRTFAILADRTAKEMPRDMVELMKNPNQEMKVTVRLRE